MTTNFYSLIAASGEAFPDALAIRWQSTSLTFSQLANRVNAVRQQISSHGVHSGDVCLLTIAVSPAAIIAILALIAEGAIPVLPPAKMTFQQWKSIRQQCGVKVLITQPRPAYKLRLLGLLSGTKLIKTSGNPSSGNPAPSPFDTSPQEVPETQPALITFSSGSTGHPKAIYRSHTVLMHQHRAILHFFPKRAETLDFPLFPNILLHNLATGISTTMPDIPDFRLSHVRPERIIAQIQRERVRTLTGNVFYFTQLLAYAEARAITLPQVEDVGVGGSPVPERLLEQLQALFCSARVYVIYGSSEAEPIAVREFTDSSDPWLGYGVGVIHPQLRWQLRPIASAQEKAVGELLIAGPHVVLPAGETWFATGDIGYMKDDKLFLTARRGNEAIIHEKQHYQLEHYLQHTEGVSQVAALANGHVFDVLFEGSATVTAVQKALRQALDAEAIGRITKTNALPVDRRHYSKILYHQLKK